MKTIRFAAAAALLCLLVPADAQPQALTSLSSLRTSYNTRKATVRPTGELKTQIDAIDQEIAAASRVGKTGEVRRLMAKGQVLLSGRAWTPELDFSNSIVLRTEQVMADSTKPYAVRIEQIYSPSTELSRSLTAHARTAEAPDAACGRDGERRAPGAGGREGFRRRRGSQP